MFSTRKRPVDEPFLLAPTTANHIFKRRAPIYIKSHGRMIPRFRAGSKKCARFYPWPHKTELHSTCHANWFPCSPFTILFDPRDSRSCSSATLVFFSCARFRVVCRKTIEKQRERERENIDSQIVISIYCGFLCKCNFFFLPFFFFFCKHKWRSGI